MRMTKKHLSIILIGIVILAMICVLDMNRSADKTCEEKCLLEGLTFNSSQSLMPFPLARGDKGMFDCYCGSGEDKVKFDMIEEGLK